MRLHRPAIKLSCHVAAGPSHAVLKACADMHEDFHTTALFLSTTSIVKLPTSKTGVLQFQHVWLCVSFDEFRLLLLSNNTQS